MWRGGCQVSDALPGKSKQGDCTRVGICPLVASGSNATTSSTRDRMIWGGGRWGEEERVEGRGWLSVGAAKWALPPSICASSTDSLKIPTDLQGTMSL